MKEQFELNGETFRFEGWRIEPPGHELPAQVKRGHLVVPPEAIFTNDDGMEMGVHPRNALVSEDPVVKTVYKSDPEKRRRKRLKHKRKLK